MSLSTRDKLKALAIVNVFETSKPFGEYAATAVLDDGAGISYGISQFTHRSGALLAVIERYLENGGAIGRTVIERRMEMLRKTDPASIMRLAADKTFKKALAAAAISGEMRSAQEEVAFNRFLKPAIEACMGSGFVLPLSLAVVYDSINHGSWEKIRDRVSARTSERSWITDYVVTRHRWLQSVPRLRKTSYRTRFFLQQIADGNWDLQLPMNVCGVKLTESIFENRADETTAASESAPQPAQTNSAVEHQAPPSADRSVWSNGSGPKVQPESSDERDGSPDAFPPDTARPPKTSADAAADPDRPPDLLDRIEARVERAAAEYDQAERIVTTVLNRRDAAKSLWTTVAGTVWQTAWAIFGLLSGMPRSIWLVAACAAAALMLLYLYRQIALGKIRESQNHLPQEETGA